MGIPLDCGFDSSICQGMGTKVQIENYLPAHYSMKDLNLESNGASWTSCFGESNLSNGQFCYGFLPRMVADSHPGHGKDVVKQTMLEHEAIFKNQVYELHRLYRVQRDLMDEARRKEQFKQRIPHETSSSSSPVPSQLQYEDVQRWSGQNLPLSNSVCGRPPNSVPDAAQSSPYSAKGKSIQAVPSSFPNCYSPKNSESDSRPSKLRRRMLDLQLPADQYIDTDEVEHSNDVKNFDNLSSSPDKNKKFPMGNGKLFPSYPGMIECPGDTSRSDLHVSKPRALADLNEPLHAEEATSVSSVDFLRRGGNHHDTQFREPSTRFLNSAKDVPQNSKNGSLNRTLSNVPFENRANGPDWLCYALESENKGSVRSISQGMCPEKVPAPSQPVHNLLDQACHPPAFLTGDHVNGNPWKPKSGSSVEKSDRGYTLSGYNVPGSVASHVPNQTGFFLPSDSGKPWDQCALPWGKSASFLGQKAQNPNLVHTSPYLTSANLSKSPQSSAQSNDLFGNKRWNLNSSPSALGTETPLRNGFCEGSSYAFKGADYVNSNQTDKTVSCSSINYFKATSCTDVNPMRDMNLNVALPNGVSDDHFSQQGGQIIDKDHKSADIPVLPWLRGKGVCGNDAENSRKGFNSLESSLSRWGTSVASNSREGDVKAKIPNCSGKILGVPIFENPPTPKKEISNPLVIHNCSGNKKSENSGRKGGFDINLPFDPTEEEGVAVEEKIETGSASLRHHFDLNSCLTEEDITCEASLPENRTSGRVDTGIDLEAPVVLEDDEEVFPVEDSSIKEPELPQHNNCADDGEAEHAKSAAEAIVAISLIVNLSQTQESTCPEEVDTDMDDPLHWFVDIACSTRSESENGDLLPEGLDDFELMTLRQKECSVEEYFPESSFPEVPNLEEKGTCLLTTTRTRKGHGRRGRQRRDFQRDILPGLTSLSRHEVTEDLQMFGGLMRATGHPWHSGPNRRNATRNGCARGRRRAVTAAAPAAVNAVCGLPPTKQQQQQQNNSTEAGIEDRSLTGWGKTTRRPRRQRYPAGNNAPPPVPLT